MQSCDDGCTLGCDAGCEPFPDDAASFQIAPPSPPLDTTYIRFNEFLLKSLAFLNGAGDGLKDFLNAAPVLGLINTASAAIVPAVLKAAMPVSFSGETDLQVTGTAPLVDGVVPDLSCSQTSTYTGEMNLQLGGAGMKLNNFRELRASVSGPTPSIDFGVQFTLDYADISGSLGLSEADLCGILGTLGLSFGSFGGRDVTFSSKIAVSGAFGMTLGLAWDKNGCASVHLEAIRILDEPKIDIKDLNFNGFNPAALDFLGILDINAYMSDAINEIMGIAMPMFIDHAPGIVNPQIDKAMESLPVSTCLDNLREQCSVYCQQRRRQLDDDFSTIPPPPASRR